MGIHKLKSQFVKTRILKMKDGGCFLILVSHYVILFFRQSAEVIPAMK